jgi:uncharacterized protein YjcR
MAKLLKEAEAAELLAVSPQTLRHWRRRTQGRGPAFVRIEGRTIRYRVLDLENYIRGGLVRRMTKHETVARGS